MKYTILSPVDHNGKRLQVGSSAEFSKANAADLLAAGSIELYDAEKAKAVTAAVETGESSSEPLDPNNPPVPPEVEGDAA